jgi:hypothetical protein
MNRWILGAVASLLVCPLFGTGACSSGASAGKSTPDGGSDAPGASYGTSPCAACVETACSGELSACSSDPECAAGMACLDACGTAADGAADPACAAACPSPAASAGLRAWQAFEGCRKNGAGSRCAECGYAPPDADVDNPILKPPNCAPSSETGCNRCIDEQCCELLAACSGNPACADTASCIAGCTNWACEAACYADPEGALDFTRYFGCVAIRCPGPESACTTPPSDCIECMTMENCRQQYADCHNNLDCYRILGCSLYCVAPDIEQCFFDCQDAYPAGAPLFNAMSACWSAQCPNCNS